jgi:hypothetical protein
MNMENISVFKNFIKEIGVRTLSEIVSGIRGVHYKEAIFQIRKSVERGEKEEVDKLKKGLLAFTVSGEFSGGRKMEFLKRYNPFVILDIDKLNEEVLARLMVKVNEIEFTRVAFISPSGRGVKIIVRVDSEIEKHGIAYKQVADYYQEILGVEIDRSGKDITRLCFMSHDPSAYFDPESKVFDVVKLVDDNFALSDEPGLNFSRTSSSVLENEGAGLKVDIKGGFAKCVDQTNEKLEFKNGNRNNFIYQLAANCSQAGIPLEVTNKLSKADFDLSNEEIDRTVKSAYNWKPRIEKAKIGKRVSIELPDETPAPFSGTVFSKLPDLLRKGCGRFKEERERDVFLTGALGVLSGCLPNVSGIYDGNLFYPNLYVFVIAPAASGKGALKFSKMLGMGYHQQLLDGSRKAQEEYKKALLEFELASMQYKKGKISEPPKEPEEAKFKTLFIPANSSSAMLVRHLRDNDESGTLFESEADTLGNVLKQDWGGYSDLMRKAYHHEPISYSRKQNNEFVEIAEPKLSVALSGTPGQVTGLIPSSEDGLFSRFLFYAFEVGATWRDVSPKGRGLDFQSSFNELSNEVLGLVSFLTKHPMDFKLSDEQWGKLNEFYNGLVNETVSMAGKEALSMVRRSGLMMFRISMIFSAIRKYEEQNVSKSIVCKEGDFEAAFSLVETYFQHAFFMFDRLPKRVKNTFQFKNVRQQSLYDKLPMKFSKKEAIEIGADLKIPKRTVGRYLHLLMKSGYLVQAKCNELGMYEKRGKG